jgi:hypothetical protein
MRTSTSTKMSTKDEHEDEHDCDTRRHAQKEDHHASRSHVSILISRASYSFLHVLV